jgi:staphylococcal nuclease domain-containing protein 1
MPRAIKIGYQSEFSQKARKVSIDSTTADSGISGVLSVVSKKENSTNSISPFPSSPSSAKFEKRPNTLSRRISPAQYSTMAAIQGRVKSVLSGDTLVLSSVKNPTNEKTVSLAYVIAPHLRKDGDEDWAFQSREFLRVKLVGKVVSFQVLFETNTQRQYGILTLDDGQKFPHESVKEGWVKLREDAGRKEDTESSIQTLNELRLLEAQAKEADKGIWQPKSGRIDIQHDLGGSDAFLEAYKGKTVDGLVERVLSGDRMLVRLLVSDKKHYQVMALVAGIRSPSTERVNPSNQQVQPAEPLGNEARAFVEARLLQRSVKIDILGVSPQGQLIASIRHPKGSIAEFLLAAGLARCTDYHSTMLGPAMATLRAAEKDAQAAKRGLHEGHVAKAKTDAGNQEGIVSRVFSADTIFVRNKAGAEKRINISSIRGPRQNEAAEAPYRDEAKEFLRKKIIGKHVQLNIDGSRPATDGYDAKEVATITLNDKNIGLLLVQEGWCSVIRHKREDPDRAPNYDELLAAQEQAKEEKKGMWSGKPSAAKHYIDASESAQKAKMQLAGLQRQKKIPAIVDFVKSGSRFVVLVPREGVKLNFVLGGIKAPKSARNANEKSEPFGQEAHDLATKRLTQRDVEIDVQNIDKVGGFIGELYIGRESFAKILVEEGFATVHQYSAEQAGNATELNAAEQHAKEARKGLWADWEPSQDAQEDYLEPTSANGNDAPAVRQKDYRDIIITNVDEAGKLKLQITGAGTSSLETMMSQFQSFHLNPSNNIGLPTDPKAGDFVSAKFSEDGRWYRARVRSNDRAAKVAEVVYIDYGNTEKIPWAKLRPLQPQFSTQKLKAQAQDAILSLIQLPTNPEYLKDAIDYLAELTAGKELVANVDYTSPDGVLNVSILDPAISDDFGDSINAALVAEGLAMVPRKIRPWEKAHGAILEKYMAKEKIAREEERRGMWEYGDLTED